MLVLILIKEIIMYKPSLKLSGLILFVFCVPMAYSQRVYAQAENNSPTRRKPNVIVILSDDQGTVDMNCYGSKDLYTPNMDKLAQRGVRFTQLYVGAPVCSPSRAALLTGRYPQRAQLPDNAHNDGGMPACQLTMAELLKGNGYRTGIFGKWHLGDRMPISPNAQGFDQFFGHKVGCIDNYSHYYYWGGPNRHDLWQDETEHIEEGKYFPDMLVREAGKFMEDNQDKPFFMYLAFNLPHYPLQAQEKYREMYKDVKDPKRRRYGAFVSTLDEKVGEVVAKLEELKLRDDTLIIFLSDHGHSTEERSFGGGGSAGPYRGHKFTVWEGGLRVPCIISWPGHVPEDQVRDQMVSSIDLFPTIAAYTDTPLPETKIDGFDIREVINSAVSPSPRKDMYWENGNRWAVRSGNWKLVKDGELFLSDMNVDTSETHNIADEHKDIVEKLHAMHDDWVIESVKQ